MSATKSAKEILLDFAESIATVIGDDATTELLSSVANFAKECPETILELQQVVTDNPDVFNNLLTKQGVTDAKETIELVKNYAPLFQSFGK